MERFDVGVIGGGSAGVAAACAAAAQGARVLLLERDPALGGNATRALVHTICGLYLSADEGELPRMAHPGFPRRFAEALRAKDGAGSPERAGRVFYLPTHPPCMERLFLELCRGAPGLETWTGAELDSAELAGETGESRLEVTMGGERRTVSCAAVVDASGDGATAASGAACAPVDPAELQHPSYIVRLRGVRTEALRGFARVQVSVAVAGAARRGTLAPDADSVVVRPSPRAGLAYLTLGVPKPEGVAYDPLDAGQRERLERRARDSAEAVVRFLRETREEFREAAIDAWPARLGIRESRRLSGIVVMNERDVLEGRRRDDEVALSTWPIELWRDHRRAYFRYPKAASSIPLGALVSASHPRLGLAGRCLSATHEAHGALRVIGTALATGEAIGITAALAADAGSTLAQVDPGRVRARIGAQLP
jgi:2-polyprenyl-6-methoxyphenol hydroxylase-like FAD-dependent oxidoreductase